MTTAAAPAPTGDRDRILQLLAAGKTVQFVSDGLCIPRTDVMRVIQSTRGWLHDADRDTAYEFGRRGTAPKLPEGVDPVPPPEIRATSKPRPGYELTQQPQDTSISGLITRARELDDKTVQRDLQRALDAVAQLRKTVTLVEERITKEREQAAARKTALAEVELYERKLREARARVKELGARKKPRPPTTRADVTPAQYRAWAAEHGMPCNPYGRVPQQIIDAYHAANGAA